MLNNYKRRNLFSQADNSINFLLKPSAPQILFALIIFFVIVKMKIKIICHPHLILRLFLVGVEASLWRMAVALKCFRWRNRLQFEISFSSLQCSNKVCCWESEVIWFSIQNFKLICVLIIDGKVLWELTNPSFVRIVNSFMFLLLESLRKLVV